MSKPKQFLFRREINSMQKRYYHYFIYQQYICLNFLIGKKMYLVPKYQFYTIKFNAMLRSSSVGA
ncbi:hypothetical protein BpHYR1_001451 [Brachionus plicatilis]|uniref:Uncharacterized protein n=1 Tax=Brachionus plicatilis TaxID=10195 RepID=A0A3M7T452_BRAPC|nr:hypothetical protein BpHYR1_001451 [Brachionus plicatilis]